MKLIVETNHIELIEDVKSFIIEWHSESTHIATSTSGSTGKPKVIRLAKDKMIASAKMTGEFLQLKSNMNALLCLSPKTIGGKMMIVRAIVWDMNLIISDLSSTPLSNIESKINFAAMVPMQVANSFKHNKNQLASIDQLIIGGGPMSIELEHDLQNLPNSIHHTFGMTETISHIALKSVSKKELNYSALPNVSFEVENNALVINAPRLGVHQLKTNDFIELISPNSFIWRGRTDFIINSGGIKFSPEEIEKKLSSIISVPYFIAGNTDHALGEKIVLILESSLKLYAKSDFLAVLNKFEIPKEIIFLPSFIRSESDKILRKETLKLIVDAQTHIL